MLDLYFFWLGDFLSLSLSLPKEVDMYEVGAYLIQIQIQRKSILKEYIYPYMHTHKPSHVKSTSSNFQSCW